MVKHVDRLLQLQRVGTVFGVVDDHVFALGPEQPEVAGLGLGARQRRRDMDNLHHVRRAAFLQRGDGAFVVGFDDGRLKTADYNTQAGFGLRGVSGEMTCFSHANDISESAIRRAAETLALLDPATQAPAGPPPRTNRHLYDEANPLDLVPFAKKVELCQKVDAAARVAVLGFSMGGAVTLASLERYPEHYAGGVSLCGANLPGEQLASDLLTTLVAFDYFFPGAEGLPDSGLASSATATLPQGELYQGIANALQRAPQHAAVLATRLQVSTAALPGTISLHALVLHELARRSGGMPVGNAGVIYRGFGDDAAFNAAVRRVTAVPAAQVYVREKLALTGVLKRPLVIQFNNDDPTIVPHMQKAYPELAARAGAKPLPQVLPAAGEGHCGFSGTQVVDALRAAARR